MVLHTETVAAGAGDPEQTLVFLHGILGSGRNLHTLAQRFVQARPNWQVLLVDLRAHGASLGERGPDTVEQAANDVADTVRELSRPARGLLGHSFGGKVALALAQQAASRTDGRSASFGHVVLVDSAPGARPDFRGRGTTLDVLDTLEALVDPWPTREAFVRALEARGQPRGIAQWLAMNLRRDGDGLHFSLEVRRLRALIDSYFSLDLWPALEALARPGGAAAVHVVIGERSDALGREDRARLAALAAVPQGRLTVDVVPSGHWVHVEAFEPLLRTLVERIQP
jgi:esterase